MAGREYECLKNHRPADKYAALSELVPDQCSARQRYRSKQGFLPKTGLRFLRNCRQRGEVVGEHVRIQKCVRRRPPSQFLLREKVENDFISEEWRHQQVSCQGLSKNGF